MSSVLDDEARWCRQELARMKHERGEDAWQCDCWIVCTEKCEREKEAWKKSQLTK